MKKHYRWHLCRKLKKIIRVKCNCFSDLDHNDNVYYMKFGKEVIEASVSGYFNGILINAGE